MRKKPFLREVPGIGSFNSSLSALGRFVGYRTERLADQNRILPAALVSVFVSLNLPPSSPVRPTAAQTTAKPAETHIADISGVFPAASVKTQPPRPNQGLQVQFGPVDALADPLHTITRSPSAAGPSARRKAPNRRIKRLARQGRPKRVERCASGLPLLVQSALMCNFIGSSGLRIRRLRQQARNGWA